MKNNKILSIIFTFCLLFSLNVFGGAATRVLTERIQHLFVKGAKSSNERIKREFDRTLDKILETIEISRKDIPEHILDRLRNATLDPLRLIDIDSPYRYRIDNFSIFFRPGYDKDLANVYRAFLQKRINIDDKVQMARLAVIVDGFVDMFDIHAHVETLSRRDVLANLFTHRGVVGLSGMPTPEFETWLAKLYEALYKKETFQEAAEGIFKNGFDKEAFFTLWEDQAFRDFIVESRFITKAHLTGHTELLIRWADELKKRPEYSDYMDQLSSFIRSSFKEAHNTYDDVTEVLSEDEFWTTVLQATREDRHFASRVASIVDEIYRGVLREDGYGAVHGEWAAMESRTSPILLRENKRV